MRKINYFGIEVTDASLEEIVEWCVVQIRQRRTIHLVTLNPDQFLRFEHDRLYHAIYHHADLVFVDGIGIILSSLLLKERFQHRVAGADLMEALCSRAAKEHFSVFLFGALPQVNKRAQKILESRYPELQIVGGDSAIVSEEGDMIDDVQPIEKISALKPDILFVALGTPKQEKWIAKYRAEMDVHCLFGVGATFDFISGYQKRAPLWLQRIGLEWLFRLLHEPRRLWKRYLIGIPSFIIFVIKLKLFSRNDGWHGLK